MKSSLLGPPVVVALALATAGGCGRSHMADDGGRPADDAVAETARMVSLSDEEWRDACAWLERERVEEPHRYWCADTDFRTEACSPVVCWAYDWSASFCLENERGERGWWSRQRSDCPTTLADWMACWETRAELVCYAGYDLTPECIRMIECWT